MSARRRRLPQTRPPRGAWLAFLALVIQVLLPFFLAVEIARSANPADTGGIPICSSLGNHDPGSASDQPGNGSCPVCAAVAAGQSFTAAAPLAVPMPRLCGRADLSVARLRGAAFLVSSPYQSRAPPSIT